jgi:ATP-dependent DNA ligase
MFRSLHKQGVRELINFSQVKNSMKEESNWDKISNYSNFIAEPKYDGVRLLAQKENGIIKIHRGLDNVKNDQFPEVLKQLANMPDNTLYDGELCILDNPNDELLKADFSAIQKRILLKEPRKINFLSNKNPATFMAFDCLIKNGIDIRKNPLLQRKQQIENCIKTLEYKPDELLQMIQKNEMEGIVLKDPNGISNTNWVKFKNWVEATYKVIGTNSLSQNISSLELENDKGIAVGSVNYQFNEPELQTDQIKEKLIGSYVEVRSMFTSKGKVRFPSLQQKDKLIKFLKSGRNLEEDFSRKSVQEILS